MRQWLGLRYSTNDVQFRPIKYNTSLESSRGVFFFAISKIGHRMKKEKMNRKYSLGLRG